MRISVGCLGYFISEGVYIGLGIKDGIVVIIFNG